MRAAFIFANHHACPRFSRRHGYPLPTVKPPTRLVIANPAISGVKQSTGKHGVNPPPLRLTTSVRLCPLVDCFVALLLAMTMCGCPSSEVITL
jgi:hypothetical protein